VTGTALSLWLAADVTERSAALDSLLTSGDLRPVQDGGPTSSCDEVGDAFGVIRVDRLLPRLEWPGPILPAAAA
jgi:hypothetical protein